MNDEEYTELCSAIDADANARYECETYNAAYIENENDELRKLVSDMHGLLQRTCESRDECGRDCELWLDHNKQCELRDVEDRMAVLGIEVPNEQ